MIDRKKVIGHLNDCMEASRRDNTWVFVRRDIVEDALSLLKEQEGVIRCKECQYWSHPPRGVMFCKRIHQFVDADWYCADGKRKDGEVNDQD